MSHKWVPQWKKDQEVAELLKKQQEAEIAKCMEKTEQNFPPLSHAIGSSKVVVWEKKFSELASDWKSEADKHIEEEKMQQEFAKSRITSAPSVPLPKAFKLPVFANKHRYVEEEEEEEEKPKQVPPSDLDDAGWTLVDTRKVRRKKTFEEVVNRPPTPEEDGVWKDDAPAEHETCWEDRH